MTANRIYIYVTAFMLTVAASAQEDNISPYSMFGIGELQLSESGRTAGMASTAIGLSGLHFLNPANPASLAALDTTTFIFDLTGSAKGSVFTSGVGHPEGLQRQLYQNRFGYAFNPAMVSCTVNAALFDCQL